MIRAIRPQEPGGHDVLVAQSLKDLSCGPGEARVRVAYAGVNYIDIYHRSGLYPTPSPLPLGIEGSGIIEAVGPGVTHVHPGMKVAWTDIPGSYATHILASEERLVPIPEDINLKQAAAVMTQGITAHYLSHETFPLGPEHTCLIHAAAGGLGLLLVQMAKQRGAQVIGTVSTPKKAERARLAGADHVILYTKENVSARVRDITAGKGAQVVFDGVGSDTLEESLQSLGFRGTLVFFGCTSGRVPTLDTGLLNRLGSLYVTCPNLFQYIDSRERLLHHANEVFEQVLSQTLSLSVDQVFSLDDAKSAHAHLESRQSIGKVLLEP